MFETADDDENIVDLGDRPGNGRLCDGVEPFESPDTPTPRGRIDGLVFARLDRLGIQPAHPCSDAVFVRRVYLDAIGTLPTARGAREFLTSQDPDKRAALIDRLLEREEFADYWAMKWSDILRVKSEFPINLWPNAVQGYHRWIRTSIRANMSYDRFVREMLTASGSNFRVPPVNFYQAVQSKEPQALAQAVALTFMGVRAESWPEERWSQMAVFFARIGYKPTGEWKEEIVLFDPNKPAAPTAVLPDGTLVQLAPDRDPREVFADWLTDVRNPWFARNIANRLWSWLLGRGIIHEPDDIRPDNPPSNPELLAYLVKELVAAHYDLKHLYRLILNSQTYQLSSIARSDSPQAKANFASYPLRRRIQGRPCRRRHEHHRRGSEKPARASGGPDHEHVRAARLRSGRHAAPPAGADDSRVPRCRRRLPDGWTSDRDHVGCVPRTI